MKKLEFAGNLGSDPKYFEAKGKKRQRALLNVHLDQPYRGEDAKDEDEVHEWLSIVVFGQQADNVVESMAKGTHVFGWGNLNLRPMEHVRTEALIESIEDLDDDDITVAKVKKLIEGESREVSLIQVNAQQIAPSTKFQSMEVEKNAKKSKSRKVTNDDDEEDETPKTKTKAKVGAKASSKSKAASEDEDDDW